MLFGPKILFSLKKNAINSILRVFLKIARIYVFLVNKSERALNFRHLQSENHASFFNFFFFLLNSDFQIFVFFFSFFKCLQIRLKMNLARELATSQSAMHLRKPPIIAPCEILSALSELKSQIN